MQPTFRPSAETQPTGANARSGTKSREGECATLGKGGRRAGSLSEGRVTHADQPVFHGSAASFGGSQPPRRPVARRDALAAHGGSSPSPARNHAQSVPVAPRSGTGARGASGCRVAG